MCLYQTSGRHPPPITGCFVNNLTRGWVGAPNERAPFRFHGAVVGFVDRRLSRTRNLAASIKHLGEFFSGRSWPKIGPGILFFGVFEKFETFFWKICAHSERYRNLLSGIFEIPTFDRKPRVSIVTGLRERISVGSYQPRDRNTRNWTDLRLRPKATGNWTTLETRQEMYRPHLVPLPCPLLFPL